MKLNFKLSRISSLNGAFLRFVQKKAISLFYHTTLSHSKASLERNESFTHAANNEFEAVSRAMSVGFVLSQFVRRCIKSVILRGSKNYL